MLLPFALPPLHGREQTIKSLFEVISRAGLKVSFAWIGTIVASLAYSGRSG